MMRALLPKPQHTIYFALALSALFVLASCQAPQVARASDYASNTPGDGGYNPYPSDANGVPHSGSLLPANNYGQRVPSPPTGYTPPPIPHSSSSTSSRVVTSSPPPKKSASTTSTSSAPKRSPATASSSKPKSSTAAKPTPKPTPKAAPKKSSSGGVHTVVSGDTLWGIARRSNTTVDKLKALNGLSTDKLKLGQKVKLP